MSEVDISRKAVERIASGCSAWSEVFGDRVAHRDVLEALRDALDKAESLIAKMNSERGITSTVYPELYAARDTIARQQRAIERKDAAAQVTINYWHANDCRMNGTTLHELSAAIAFTGEAP